MIKLIRPSECAGFTLKEDGDIEFYDYSSFYNFAVGDQIHLKLRFGTRVYNIVDVQPANHKDYPPDMTLVMARPE